MWKNIAETDRPQMKIWRARIVCWVPKATHTHKHTHTHTHPPTHTHTHTYIQIQTQTHSEYIIFILFPQQQCLHQRASMLRYTYIVCTVCVMTHICRLLIYRTVSYCNVRKKFPGRPNYKLWIKLEKTNCF